MEDEIKAASSLAVNGARMTLLPLLLLLLLLFLLLLRRC
jgi:hypothetical protein